MSTPAAAYDSPSLLTSLDFRELGRRGSRNVIRLQRQLELHLVHLQLLRHGYRVRTVEAGAAELPRGTSADRTDQARDREIAERIGADLLPHLLDRAAGGDQLLGRADVDANEEGKPHRWAGDPHVNLRRSGARTRPVNGPERLPRVVGAV